MPEVKTPVQATAPRAPDNAEADTPRLGFLLKHAQLRFQELTAAAFETLGIRPTEWVALNCLDEQRGLSQKEVADLLGIDRTSMVAVVDELESKGLVERRPQADDRRKNRIMLTPQGRKMMQRGDRLADDCEHRFLAPLDGSTRQQLRNALAAVITADLDAAHPATND